MTPQRVIPGLLTADKFRENSALAKVAKFSCALNFVDLQYMTSSYRDICKRVTPQTITVILHVQSDLLSGKGTGQTSSKDYTSITLIYIG